jgi:large subunit ribosomal protein L27
MAHKKAQWSTSNGRDSNAKRLGVKLFGWQKAVAGNIIVRQKGNKYYPLEGVSQGKDFTLFATVDGTVKFSEKNRVRYDGRVYKDTYVSVV